jgi:hypothetical protein
MACLLKNITPVPARGQRRQPVLEQVCTIFVLLRKV